MLIGVGNRLLGDDGAGPEVSVRLGESGWLAVDCGPSLENAVGLVTRWRPDLLVVVDAARMGLPAGAVRSLPRPSGERMLASTHGLPLSFVLDRVEEAARRIVLIGIEPQDLTPGAGLSAPVRAAVERLAWQLQRASVHEIPELQ